MMCSSVESFLASRELLLQMDAPTIWTIAVLLTPMFGASAMEPARALLPAYKHGSQIFGSYTLKQSNYCTYY
jgi:hypothetical protein